MAFVAVIDLRIHAEGAQGADAAETEEEFLLEAVLPAAAIELVGDLAVFGAVGLIIGIQQVQVGAADFDFPQAGAQVAAREGDLGGHPLAFGVKHRLGRDIQEVLRLIACLLVTLGGQHLGEVAITVQQADGDQVDIHVRGLLQVVTGQDTQAAGVDFQGSVKSVLHAEIGDGGIGAFGLRGHVSIELVHDGVQLGKESLVLCQFVESLQANGIEDDLRVVAGLVPDLGVDGLEQGLGAVVPAPPEVFGKGLKTGELRRKVACHHDTRPGGSIDFDFFVSHGFMLGFRKAGGRIGNLAEGDGIRLLVIGDLVLPKGDGGHVPGILHIGGALRLVQPGDLTDAGLDRLDDFVIIGIVALDDRDARMGLLLVMVADPESETGQARGQGRDPERQRLERGVAPGLVVGREEGQVHADEQVVVLHVEDAVVAIEVGRDEVDLHAAAHGIDQAEFAEAAGHLVILGISQVVRSLGRIALVAAIGQFGLQGLVRAVVGSGDHDEGVDLPAFPILHLAQGVNEHVNALVAVFIPAADGHENGIGGHVLTGHRAGDFEQAGTGGGTLLRILLVGGRGEAVLEAVRRHHVDRTMQELGALAGRDLTDRREGVGILRAGGFHGVPGRHAESGGHLVAVIGLHLVIQGEIVAGDAAAHHGRMGRERRGHGDLAALEVQQARGRLPLVELGDHLVGRTQVLLVETLDDPPGHVTEQDVFLVVPVAGDGVHAVLLPVFAEDLVGIGQELLIIDQDGDRPPGHVPASDADLDSVLGGASLPSLEKMDVLREIRVVIGVHPYVRTDEDVVLSEF